MNILANVLNGKNIEAGRKRVSLRKLGKEQREILNLENEKEVLTTNIELYRAAINVSKEMVSQLTKLKKAFEQFDEDTYDYIDKIFENSKAYQKMMPPASTLIKTEIEKLLDLDSPQVGLDINHLLIKSVWTDAINYYKNLPKKLTKKIRDAEMELEEVNEKLEQLKKAK